MNSGSAAGTGTAETGPTAPILNSPPVARIAILEVVSIPKLSVPKFKLHEKLPLLAGPPSASEHAATPPIPLSQFPPTFHAPRPSIYKIGISSVPPSCKLIPVNKKLTVEATTPPGPQSKTICSFSSCPLPEIPDDPLYSLLMSSPDVHFEFFMGSWTPIPFPESGFSLLKKNRVYAIGTCWVGYTTCSSRATEISCRVIKGINIAICCYCKVAEVMGSTKVTGVTIEGGHYCAKT